MLCAQGVDVWLFFLRRFGAHVSVGHDNSEKTKRIKSAHMLTSFRIFMTNLPASRLHLHRR